MTKTSLFALVVTLLGCEAASLRPAEPSAPKLEAVESKPAPAKPSDLAWGNAIAWRDWDSAMRAAKAEHKSVCVVVYADWCPRCKELAPEFAKPELASAAAGLIMVRQDQDEKPAWLQERLGKYGDYVPRILFLDATGAVREDLQSGHPRYPYFYAPLVTDQLAANMRLASR